MVTGRYKFENLDKIELSPLSSKLEQKSVVPTRRTRSKLPPSPPHIPSDIISKLRTMPSLSNFSRTFRVEKQFSHGRNINVPSKLNQNEHYKYRLRKFISEQRIKVESSKANSENAWFTPFNVEKFLPVVEDSDLDSQNSLKMNEFKTANEHNRMKISTCQSTISQDYIALPTMVAVVGWRSWDKGEKITIEWIVVVVINVSRVIMP
ncbi:hypothetical protein RDWZM_008951 [Blomia tropicalis]|uniref:Uncharacterized protein n=1 Tax=Blomia tropicalis TaxID=40697 RepID=A0A9Q0RKI9_BLOTA|nr:hypothetical protein RDWZM_008951 [Blomia tropicalis]